MVILRQVRDRVSETAGDLRRAVISR